MEIQTGTKDVEIKHNLKVQNGKLLRCSITISNRNISKIIVSGDFYIYPEDCIERLEDSLLNKSIDEINIQKSVQDILNDTVTLVGFSSDDMTNLLNSAITSANNHK